MIQPEKYNVYPSTGALYNMKSRMQNATRGHNLLKKKSDALEHRARCIILHIVEMKDTLCKLLQEASMSLAEVKYATNDIPKVVLESVTTAQTRICTRRDSIVGVQVPVFLPVLTGSDSFCLAGLGRCGQRMNRLKQNYQQALEMSTELASLQSAFVTINDVIKLTNRRVNVLGHVIIPRIQCTISYIEMELDEKERENLYRLKLVQKRKQRENIQTCRLNFYKSGEKEKDKEEANKSAGPPRDLVASYLFDKDILF